MYLIRPFNYTDADYQHFVDLHNQIAPYSALSVNECRLQDEQDNARYRRARFVIDDGDQLVAACEYSQNHWDYHPHHFSLALYVAARADEQALRQRLYAQLLTALQPHDPRFLNVYIREDRQTDVAFYLAQQFAIMQRNPNGVLHVPAFDFSRFAAAEQRVQASGIAIDSFAALKRHDPDVERKVYELETTLEADIPRSGIFTPRTFEAYRAVFDDPGMLPDGMLIALDGDRYVGMTELFQREAAPNELHQGMTGVLASHRRRGIAMALKVAGIRFAANWGATHIFTDNEENNPMFQLNVALGFEPLPADLVLEKWLVDG
jgi:GNAT superfamily N-acetyltransferase